MPIEIIPAARYHSVPWKNGGGVTHNIAERLRPGGQAADWSAVVWRLSLTTITMDGPFSDFTGFDRLQAVLRGGGVTLRVAGHPDLPVRIGAPVRYPGEWKITAALVDGPTTVMNLILARGLARGDLAMIRGSAAFAPGASRLVHAVDGAVTVNGARVSPGDSAAVPAAEVCAIESDGGALVASVTLEDETATDGHRRR